MFQQANGKSSNKNILIQVPFKGREDVFATRWEKDKKCGYMPAYFFDPYRFRTHKMKSGTFQNYPDKSYLQLTDDQIARHLNGEQLVGLYPLLFGYFLTRHLLLIKAEE